jgi:hypothetical protein
VSVYRFNHHVWEMRDLTVYERIVLLYLLDRANEHGVCWPSLSTISRATGVSRKQVGRVLKSLRTRGLVDWEHIGEEGWRHNSYRLNLEAIARGGDSGKTRIEGASSEGRGLGGSVHQSLGRDYQSLGRDYQSLGRDYQSLGRDYQSLGRDYQTPGWGLPDTGVGTLTNPITIHITTQIKISSLSRSTVANFTMLPRVKKRRGGQKLWPRKKTPKTLNPPLRARVSCLKKKTPPLVKRRTSPPPRTP